MRSQNCLKTLTVCRRSIDLSYIYWRRSINSTAWPRVGSCNADVILQTLRVSCRDIYTLALNGRCPFRNSFLFPVATAPTKSLLATFHGYNKSTFGSKSRSVEKHTFLDTGLKITAVKRRNVASEDVTETILTINIIGFRTAVDLSFHGLSRKRLLQPKIKFNDVENY